MAAPFSHAAPKSRLVFDKNNTFPKGIYFTHSATVIIPYDRGSGTVAQDMRDLEHHQTCQVAHHTPLYVLLDPHFIQAFVKRGQLHMLSHRRHIDTQNCVALIPTGHLILNITKDTYEHLGLEGKPSAFSSKGKPTKYVVDVDLTAKSFTPGRKGYERVLWCLKDRLDMIFDLLFSWTPHDELVCSSSVGQYLRSKEVKVTPVPLCVRTQWLVNPSVPIVDPSVATETEQSVGREALWEWLGAVACGIDMSESSPDSYVSTLDCPSPSSRCERCLVLTVSGLLTPPATAWLLQRVRREVDQAKAGARWGSMTLHGFQDSPVSVRSREHGFFTSGDCLHSLVCFPGNESWLYSAFDQHDFVQ